jgi:ribosomal protein S18 acetylase RimI-like enzyme
MKKEVKVLTQNDKGMVLNYLERNHIETTFLIGNVNDFGLDNDKSQRRCGDYFGYFEDDNLKGILPIYNLGSCIPHFESEGAVPFFVDIMKERKFNHLLGMASTIKPIYDKLKAFKIIEEYSDDSYLINNDNKPFSIQDLELKDFSSVEPKLAAEFLQEARNKGFGENITEEEAYKNAINKPDEEDLVFGVKAGRIVALALIQTTTSKINQIGGVYTSEEYRGKGYCKAVVSEICNRIIARGKTPTLMVRKDNTPAVKAYSALGFKYYTDYNIITLK